MAEFVEYRCEEWIPELEKMERIRLFELKEIRSLVTKKREFEYKLERRTKSKEDFLKYIQFEIDLLRIIIARREKTGINTSKGEIEYKIINRIIRLFKRTIFRFQSDIKLWMTFFKFCDDFNLHSVVSKMLVRMLQIHSGKPELWVYAAKWELEHEKSFKNAREFLTKGLRHHSSSSELYIELFKLELQHMQKKMKTKEIKKMRNRLNPDEVLEKIVSGKLVDVVYNSAIAAIDTADFKVSLLNATKDYEEISNIDKTILQDLIRYHSTEEVTWNVIAKRELEGYSCDWNELKEGNEFMEEEQDENDEQKIISRKRIQRSIDVFKNALKKLNTPKMWNYYLDHVIEIYNNSQFKSILPKFTSEVLDEAMKGALDSSCLAEEYLLKWIELLKNPSKSNKLLKIYEKGVQQFPNSLPLWHSYIRYYLSLDDEQNGKIVFKKAIKNISDGVPLWELMIEYYRLKNSPKIEETFKAGIQNKGNVAQMLKPLYLEWLVLNKGITEARKIFETSELQNPPCLEVFKMMGALEINQPECSHKHVRRCHELACSYFGKSDSTVWLDYIKWEMNYGDATKSHQIYSRALKILTPEKVDDFVSEFNFIKLNVTS